MMRKVMIPVMALSFVLATSAYADGGYGKFGKGGHGSHGGVAKAVLFKGHMVLAHADTIGLTAEQEKAVRDIKTQVKKDLIRTKAEVKILDLDIRSGLKDGADPAAVQKLIDQKYEAKKALEKGAVASYAKLKGALSDDQWQKLRDLKKQGMQAHSKR